MACRDSLIGHLGGTIVDGHITARSFADGRFAGDEPADRGSLGDTIRETAVLLAGPHAVRPQGLELVHGDRAADRRLVLLRRSLPYVLPRRRRALRHAPRRADALHPSRRLGPALGEPARRAQR